MPQACHNDPAGGSPGGTRGAGRGGRRGHPWLPSNRYQAPPPTAGWRQFLQAGAGKWIDPRAGAVALRRFAEQWLKGKAALAPKTCELYEYLLSRLILPTSSRSQPRDGASSISRPASLTSWRPTSLSSSHRIPTRSSSPAAPEDRFARATSETASGFPPFVPPESRSSDSTTSATSPGRSPRSRGPPSERCKHGLATLRRPRRTGISTSSTLATPTSPSRLDPIYQASATERG
ncbi:hypothetical protein BH20ACT1_BH20ACT1_03270 [soil metagenome]